MDTLTTIRAERVIENLKARTRDLNRLNRKMKKEQQTRKAPDLSGVESVHIPYFLTKQAG